MTFQLDGITVHCQDVLAWALDYKCGIAAGEVRPISCFFTDPPYALGDPPPMDKLLRAWLAGDDFDGFSKGFMQTVWDTMPPPTTWRAFLEIAHPGAWLFAYTSSRTQHLLGTSLALGGWEVRDSIVWLHGQGFSHGANVSKKLDGERKDDVRHVTAFIAMARDAAGLTNGDIDKHFKFHGMAGHWTSQKSQASIPKWEQWSRLKELLGFGDEMDAEVWRLNERKGQPGDAWHDREDLGAHPNPNATGWVTSGKAKDGRARITAPATPIAKLFDGYHSRLKGMHEVVIMAQAPRQGHTFAQLARRWGVGGLNVGASRVGNETLQYESRTHRSHRKSTGQEKTNDGRDAVNYERWATEQDGQHNRTVSGRFPPNATFSHTPPSPCPTCHTAGVIESLPMEISFDEWYAATKAHGGTRREWEKLRKGGGSERCPTCHGAGWVGGCVRRGSKRVASNSVAGGFAKRETTENWRFDNHERTGYADADGNELVADFECVEGCAVAMLAQQSGERPTGGGRVRKAGSFERPSGWKEVNRTEAHWEASTGNTARYYHNHDWQLDTLEPPEISPFFYCAKASRSERDAGCDNLPLVKGHSAYGDFAGTPEHATNTQGELRNSHPTVKPLALNKHLAGLLKPPDEFEPVLCVPFSGSGSEIIGAMLAGWQNIIGIEREPEYHAISEARIAWWHKWRNLTQLDDPAQIRKAVKVAEAKRDDAQLDMFGTIEEATK